MTSPGDEIYADRLARTSTPADPIPLTERAVKYGERSETYHQVIERGHSGLSPHPFFTGPQSFPATEPEYWTYSALCDYQRLWMGDYTTSELRILFAIDNADAKPSTLHKVRASQSDEDISLSPVLQRRNWVLAIPRSCESTGTFEDNHIKKRGHFDLHPDQESWRPRIPGTTEGFADVDYEPLWEAILPALRLASRLLTNLHGSSIIYDTMFNGPRFPIPDHRKPPDYTGDLFSMWPTAYPPTSSSIFRDWTDFSENIYLCIDSDKQSGLHAFTSISARGRAIVALNIHRIIPLLSNRLRESERHINTFALAVTLMHELAHGIIYRWERKKFDRENVDVDEMHIPNEYEPYFCDEPVAEAGWSAENALWGGVGDFSWPQLARDRDEQEQSEMPHGPPYMFVGTDTFPSRERLFMGAYGQNPALDDFAAPGLSTLYRKPINLQFLQDIQTPEFWDVIVDKYSMEMLKKNSTPYFVTNTREWTGAPGVFPLSWDLKGHRDEAAVREMRQFFEDPLRHTHPDWLFRERSMRRIKRTVEDFEYYKRSEIRAWKGYKYVEDIDNYVTKPWGDPQSPSFTLDAIILDISTKLQLPVPAMRLRGRKFLQSLVRHWLELRGVSPDEYINFRYEDVLLNQEQRDRGVVATDLDDIVRIVLARQRKAGNDLSGLIASANNGGDTQVLEDLAHLVRQWLREQNDDPQSFDDEMRRRNKDPREIFYVKPNFEAICSFVRQSLIEEGTVPPEGLSLAEYVRDQLRAEGYPRNALDADLGPSGITLEIPDLEAARQEFFASFEMQFNLPPEFKDDRSNWAHILPCWRDWLIARQYSTATLLFP